MAGEIFISYRRSDESRARLLYELLKERGVEAWYDRHVAAGEDWRSATANALVKAPIFVLLFSKNAAQSDDIIKELSAATFQKKAVVPVRIEDIHPEGAFLYELASRNWFDAFNDTEARLATLADQLAALVKGGPEAQAAAGRLGAAAPLPPAKSKEKSGRIALGVAAIAVLGVVAIVAMPFISPKRDRATDLSESQRTAFFGFTAADTSAPSVQVAGVATDETYATLTVLGIETAARGDTEGVALKDQLARADKLKARYALGGSVRTTGDQVAVTIRLDDAQTRATLWQKTLTGGTAQSESLPVQAAGKATNLLQCLINVRPGMAREDAGAMGLVTRACDTEAFDPETLMRWQEVARIAPRSAVPEYITGLSWIVLSVTETPANRQAMIQQARQAFDRALAIEPGSAQARSGVVAADVASDRPLAEILRDLNSLLQVGVDRSNRRNISSVTFIRLALLSAVGKPIEAARLGRTDAAADPLNPGLQSFYAGALFASGQTAEARRVYESVNRRLADSGNWSQLAYLVIFEGGDLAPVVAAAPPGVTAELIDCMEDVARAARAPTAKTRKAGAQRMQECTRSGAEWGGGAATMASLGDLDAAFGVFGQLLDRYNPVGFISSGTGLFGPQARALRADPRFLPLMKQADIYQYWLDTGTQPDVCETPEERDFEVCRELRKDRAGR